MNRISSVHGRQVFDSRGRPTVEVEVSLTSGVIGRASVPSGASTGSNEANELRDGDQSAFNGLGVLSAVQHVDGEINAALEGRDPLDQGGCDELLRELDGTPELARLGANAVLGTSLAVCRAAATETGQPLFRRIAALAGIETPTLPMPMVNILSGGMHARHAMDIQDLLAIPLAASSMLEAIAIVSRVRDAATAICQERDLPTLLADEGGLSPGCRTGRDALELMVRSIERAGLEPGADVGIAIDVAATSLFDPRGGNYHLAREGRRVSTHEMIETVASWVHEFPILSVEDPLDEEDWEGWQQITSQLGDSVQLLGDDLFTTNLGRVTRGIDDGCANAVLVKLNQNGTLTGTLEVLATATSASFAPVVSARSGETEDDLLADLAVGTAAGQIKVGSVRSSERLAKYNQLVRIAENPGIPFSQFPGARRTPMRGAA